MMRIQEQAPSFCSFKALCVVFYKLAFVLLVLNLFGCVIPKEPMVESVAEPAPAPTAQYEELKTEIARLEKLIAEKDTLIKNQNIRQQNQANVLREANKEVTRAQVKLHRLATKPSTASAIAELEVALENSKQAKISPSDQILQAQAQRLLETASSFYEKDHYASAMNQVAQANHLLSLISDQNRKKASNITPMLIEFNTPVKLRTKTSVKLRKDPNAQAKILSVLKKNTLLVANANHGSWLRVQVADKQGWVLSSALEVEENRNP
jgi:hypothetical protein